MSSSSSFAIGTLVFAKMKGFPYWPGIVSSPSEELMKVSKASNPHFHCIFFFGTRNYSWVNIHNLKLYSESKEKLSKTLTTKAFKKACREIEQFDKRGLSVESLKDDELDKLFPSSTLPAVFEKPQLQISGKPKCLHIKPKHSTTAKPKIAARINKKLLTPEKEKLLMPMKAKLLKPSKTRISKATKAQSCAASEVKQTSAEQNLPSKPEPPLNEENSAYTHRPIGFFFLLTRLLFPWRN